MIGTDLTITGTWRGDATWLRAGMEIDHRGGGHRADAELRCVVRPQRLGKVESARSHREGAISIDGVAAPQGQPSPFRLFALGQLVAAIEGPTNLGNYKDSWVALQQQVQNLTVQYRPQMAQPQLEQTVQQQILAGGTLSAVALQRMLAAANKQLTEFTVSDFRRHSPSLIRVRDPFTIGVAEVFGTYHGRRDRNRYLRFLAQDRLLPDSDALSETEFVELYGPPPWELLNQTLRLVGLDYAFRPPEGVEDNLIYEPLLTLIGSDTRIKLVDLSSGEKTLLAVALSMYTGSRMGETISLPQALLLDEADASLHPSMVQSLLTVVEEILCKQHGVKVILTTHSPTTVALAPSESLYTMRRSGQPRLAPATRDEALASLTVGIPTLSVKLENRRQVFVEAEVDEACYQAMYQLVRPTLASEISLDFIASGRGGQGDCNAVKHLVTALRDAGNDLVLGLVDRDNRGGAPDSIKFLGSRYALENLVLDPLPVGAYLVRESVVKNIDVGIPEGLRHFELTVAHAQVVSDFVTGKVRRPNDDVTLVAVEYQGGFSTLVPSFYLNTNGHDLEQRLKDAFPPLMQFSKTLMATIIGSAYKEVDAYIPSDVKKVFLSLATH